MDRSGSVGDPVDAPAIPWKGHLMNAIMQFFKRVGHGGYLSDRERDEAWLSESSDLYDLEWRMRQLDRKQAEPGGPWAGSYTEALRH
jgi:hypothetical protein